MIHNPSSFAERYLSEADAGTFLIQDQALLLSVPETGAQLRLDQAQLSQLANYRRASINGLTYFDHCGLHTGRYAEFLIYLNGCHAWPTKNALPFRVGDVQVSAGRCSHLIPLLFEPFYSDDRFNQMGFNEYSSIRLVGVTHESASDVIHEALYYLNSAYLDPIKTGAQIHHLRTQNDLRKLIKQEKADAVSRKRVRRREPIANQPAVLLFNRASVTYGEASFLEYFRVLEYFAQSGFEIEVQKSRRDESVPVRSLIRIVQDRSDKVQMLHLLRAVTTPTQRGRLLDYAVHHKLGHYKDLDSLAESLYKFRNSVVHAKAVEIARTLLPNPLSPENALTHWIYLAREMSMIAIRKLGSNDLTHNNIHQ